MKGLIALDIDGTLTHDMQPTPQEVVDYLHALVDEGWALCFITGRTFHWGYEAIKELQFPYYYAVQNGAAILHMPEKELIQKTYIDREVLPQLASLVDDLMGGFVIYSGYEQNDRCFYAPDQFTDELLTYLKERCVVFREEWVPVPSLEDISLDSFPVVKYFGDEPSAHKVATRIEEKLGLEAPVIRDPFNERYALMQSTSPGINKGRAVNELMHTAEVDGPVIGAGDDNNDYQLLLAADIKVAMANAPDRLKEMADIIAPLASEKGIITGLQKAIALLEK